MDVQPFNVKENDIQGNVVPLPGGSLENWKSLVELVGRVLETSRSARNVENRKGFQM